MQITVALDSNRRRDLTFFSGDDTEIVVTVYENDGDLVPITVSDKSLVYDLGTRSQATGVPFTAGFDQRTKYTLVGNVSGSRTTLAFGYLIRKWDDWSPNAQGLIEPLFVRNEVSGGTPGSYFEGPGTDGGGVT